MTKNGFEAGLISLSSASAVCLPFVIGMKKGNWIKPQEKSERFTCSINNGSGNILYRMLPSDIKKRAEYLSAHFDDKECRNELRRLIHKYIKLNSKNYEQ